MSKEVESLIRNGWRERWTDIEWGINVKDVIPRGVSGDCYHLADCLLQQALIGSAANPLLVNYLKHSLCARLISHAAVLELIATYEHFERNYCITSLLEFLMSIIDGVTCRTKKEETSLPGAVVKLTNWLLQIFSMIVTHYEINGEISTAQSVMLEYTCNLIEKIANNQFLIGMLYVGRQEDPDFYAKTREKYNNIKTALGNSNFTPQNPAVEQHLYLLAHIDLSALVMRNLNPKSVETVTYCLQPLLSVEVLLHPYHDTSHYVAEMQMMQRLKKFSNPRLFYEIIRACFISLSNVEETFHDTMWGAFTFFKVPHIIKQLHAMQKRTSGQQTPTDHIPEVVEAFEMLLEDNLLLDFMDTKCSCNIIEYLLDDWKKHHLVNDVHVKHFAARRENISSLLQKRESGNQAPSIINFIIRAEVPLSGILKTLSTDYNKVQEALLGVLCQVLVGNSFDLILSVATVEGRLKTFVSRLIQCNENSKQVPGEVGKASVIRSTLFDVSFLMLTFIVQTYGSDVVLSENGDSFFEKWVRDCMVERSKPINQAQMIALCDENIVDELLLSLSKPEAQLKNSTLTWQDICINLPGVLNHVLIAWENETLSSADVKGILDNIKWRLFSFSVCATSFLCAYMFSVREHELLKPLNMIQQFLAPPTGDEMSSQENVKERLGLSFKIIRKMQHDVHPSGNLKSRNITLTQNLASHTALTVQFSEVWHTVAAHGWLPVRATQALKSLLNTGGPTWLVKHLVEEILKCKYTRDMMKTMDLVFAIFHLDIETTTVALLEHVVIPIVYYRQGKDVNEPQTCVLARLCVSCIISCMEASKQSGNKFKKRTRSNDDDMEVNRTKLLKLNEGSENSCSNDFQNDNHLLNNSSNNNVGNASVIAREPNVTLAEPLQRSIKSIFQEFQCYVVSDEMSLKIYFVYQFFSLLVECAGSSERVLPVLQLLPPNLIQGLLKAMVTDDMSVGLIARLYDLRSTSGRQAAVSDLCLLRNITLRNQSIQL